MQKWKFPLWRTQSYQRFSLLLMPGVHDNSEQSFACFAYCREFHLSHFYYPSSFSLISGQSYSDIKCHVPWTVWRLFFPLHTTFIADGALTWKYQVCSDLSSCCVLQNRHWQVCTSADSEEPRKSPHTVSIGSRNLATGYSPARLTNGHEPSINSECYQGRRGTSSLNITKHRTMILMVRRTFETLHKVSASRSD